MGFQCILSEYFMCVKSESEKYVQDIGPHVKLLLQKLKQHLLRNHFALYVW